MSEFLSAPFTAVWLFSGVNSAVLGQVILLRELLSTFLTLIRLLSSMSSFVFLRISHVFPGKCLAANGAQEGFDFGVTVTLVAVQSGKGHSTLSTLERSFSRMNDSSVIKHCRSTRKHFSTLST